MPVAEWRLVCQFCLKIGCHGNNPWGIGKTILVDHLRANAYHLVKKM